MANVCLRHVWVLFRSWGPPCNFGCGCCWGCCCIWGCCCRCSEQPGHQAEQCGELGCRCLQAWHAWKGICACCGFLARATQHTACCLPRRSLRNGCGCCMLLGPGGGRGKLRRLCPGVRAGVGGSASAPIVGGGREGGNPSDRRPPPESVGVPPKSVGLSGLTIRLGSSRIYTRNV